MGKSKNKSKKKSSSSSRYVSMLVFRLIIKHTTYISLCFSGPLKILLSLGSLVVVIVAVLLWNFPQFNLGEYWLFVSHARYGDYCVFSPL